MKKLYWFCFTFKGDSLSPDWNQCTACTYKGYDSKNITLEKITANKKHAGVANDSVLIALSYLGHMTKDEFEGQKPE